MHSLDIYKDIANRTGGDIYLGVVGPVRTGKSTFIKKFMDIMVMPEITDENVKNRAKDELPQSAAGKTIMTSQPKFVPEDAVRITLDDEAEMRLRLIDCVGYMVDEALGYNEFDAPRMVMTPWFDTEIPFLQAAETGTRKVIEEHSTIGIVVTSDGSITDINRNAYVLPEEKVINDLKTINRPFVIVLNTTDPQKENIKKLGFELEKKYSAPVIIMDILSAKRSDFEKLLKTVVYEFPISELLIDMPGWVCAANKDHEFIKQILEKIKGCIENINKLSDVKEHTDIFDGIEYIHSNKELSFYPGEGRAVFKIDIDESLFYKILGEECGYTINDDRHLMSTMKKLVAIKNEYDKIEAALQDVNTFRYGIVSPKIEEMALEKPEIVKHGNKFGVKLKASAPSLHLVKVDIKTEVSPILGSEKQSSEMAGYLEEEFENDPQGIWSTDIFGKSLHELVKDGIASKLANLNDDAKDKMQKTLERVVNEGDGGMLCILL